MAPQHSFIAERIDNTFYTSMKGWNKMFIAVIFVEVCIFGKTPVKLLDGRAIFYRVFFTIFWQYFGSFKRYIYNSVVFISKESYALWNFSLNYPCIRGNLRIHRFPWPFVNVRVLFCAVLRIIFLSQLLLTAHRGKTCIDLWFKTRIDVSNTCCYQRRFKQPPALLLWDNQMQNRGDFRRWRFAAVFPVRFPLGPHCSNWLKPSLLPTQNCLSPM